MKWVKISGFPTYMISDSGNVKNLITNTVLKPKQRFDGYLEVALSYNGKVTSKKIHRLVAENFLKKPSSGNYIVGHKNNKRTDNRVSNLEWMTQSDNNKAENQDDEQDYQNDSKKRTFSSKSFKK